MSTRDGQSDDLLDLGEVAQALKVTRDHARSLCVSGRLPFVNVGTSDTRVFYRVRRCDLADFKRRVMRKSIDAQVAAVTSTRMALTNVEEYWQ